MRGHPFDAGTLCVELDVLVDPVRRDRRSLGIDENSLRLFNSTLKYRPDYPDRFGSLQDARAWARVFFAWYNQEHYHTGIALLTPEAVHYGRAEAVMVKRQQVLQAAYDVHPERFVNGSSQPPALPKEVWINKPSA